MDGPSIKSCVPTILCGRFKVINEGVAHIFSLPCLWKIKCICCRVTFTNYVDKNSTNFYHVSIPCGHVLIFPLPCPHGHFEIKHPPFDTFEWRWWVPILVQFFQPFNFISYKFNQWRYKLEKSCANHTLMKSK